MKCLSIDTTGRACTVSVSEGFTVRAGDMVQTSLTHSETLMPLIERALADAHIPAGDLDAIAVSAGPGSFTGLRIGAASAKALGLALDIPLICVPTLAGLAARLIPATGLICPLMDARRNQVYAGLYRMTEDGFLETVHSDAPVAVREVIEMLNARGEKVSFTGDGMIAYREQLREHLTVPYVTAPMQSDHQDAACIAFLAASFLEGAPSVQEAARLLGIRQVSADAFTPVYLRPAQAERESVTIRPMEEGDVAGAYALESASFSRPWTKEMLRSAAVDEDSIALVTATQDGRIVGTCFVKNIAGEGTVTNVNVDRDFRRQGIGEAMLSILIEEGREAGIDAFTLEVRTGNAAARRLYEKCGFVSEGVRPSFYVDPKEDAAIYWLRQESSGGEK